MLQLKQYITDFSTFCPSLWKFDWQTIQLLLSLATLVLTKNHYYHPQVDPTRVLAQRAVNLVKNSALVVSSEALLKVKSFSGAD